MVDIIPGTYQIQVRLSSFSSITTDSVELHVGEVLRRDFVLTPAAMTESLDIVATTSSLTVDTANISNVVSQTQVAGLPLNGRQLQNLTLLAPGAVAGWILSTAANRYGKARENLEGAFVINGARGRSIIFFLTGCRSTSGNTALSISSRQWNPSRSSK